MNKTVKYALVVTACNIAALLLSVAFGDIGLLLVVAMALVVELIVGLVFIISDSKSIAGSGLLIAIGLTLVIGLGICSVSMMSYG